MRNLQKCKSFHEDIMPSSNFYVRLMYHGDNSVIAGYALVLHGLGYFG